MASGLDRSAVVVTGASSGIGRATALAFADRGAAVAVSARREHALRDLAEECLQRGAADVLPQPADVADADAVDNLARAAAEAFGRIDVWVNNAAVHLFGRLEEVPVADWHRVVETNLLGTYHGARAALPWFREQGGGVLVNVSSVLGKVTVPYQSAYVASKHAIRALSDCVREETRDVDDLHVCTVLPGPIDTPLFDQAANYTGWRVKPVQPVIDADRVARAIVRCARRPRPEVAVGASTRGGLLAERLAPRWTERLAAVQVEADHFADEPAPPTSGNLHDADASASTVDGGWQQADGSRLRKLAAAGAAGAAAALVVARRRA